VEQLQWLQHEVAELKDVKYEVEELKEEIKPLKILAERDCLPRKELKSLHTERNDKKLEKIVAATNNYVAAEQQRGEERFRDLEEKVEIISNWMRAQESGSVGGSQQSTPCKGTAIMTNGSSCSWRQIIDKDAELLLDDENKAPAQASLNYKVTDAYFSGKFESPCRNPGTPSVRDLVSRFERSSAATTSAAVAPRRLR
jgi:hypothetical protein